MKQLTQKEVQEIMNGTGTILFTTPGCDRCKTVKEIIKDCVDFGSFELTMGVFPQQELRITSAPVVVHFRNGKETGRLRGINNLDAYRRLING